MNDSAEHLDVISENLKNKYAVQTGGISKDVFRFTANPTNLQDQGACSGKKPTLIRNANVDIIKRALSSNLCLSCYAHRKILTNQIKFSS
jgi:hypothetical protein